MGRHAATPEPGSTPVRKGEPEPGAPQPGSTPVPKDDSGPGPVERPATSIRDASVLATVAGLAVGGVVLWSGQAWWMAGLGAASTCAVVLVAGWVAARGPR